MTKRRRIQRTQEELKNELIEQLQLLQHSCKAYDQGFEAMGKHIALSLRILLHHHGQSKSLLDQLGLRSGQFFDSCGRLNPRNLLTECNLVLHQISPTEARYLPLVAIGGGPRPLHPVNFLDWWNNPVLKDNQARTFCRRELILNVANTDGGAHVDPDLDEAYLALSRKNSLGWMFQSGDIVSAMKGRPELACIRQIAHELLVTLHTFIPEFSSHAEPIIPPLPT